MSIQERVEPMSAGNVAPLPKIQQTHPRFRFFLERVQDFIIFGLCLLLFIAMLVKLVHICELMLRGTDFSKTISDVLFVLVLIELFRLLIIYLEEHRISVSTMVEVGIVSSLREVILRGVLEIDWRQLLVLCAFILALGVVLRYSGIRVTDPGKYTS